MSISAGEAKIHPCIQEFNNCFNQQEEATCLIFIRHGTLNLNSCSLSLESLKPNTIPHSAPCIY